MTIDLLNKSLGVGVGNRIELGFGMVYFLLGALALRPVVEPDRRRSRRHPRLRSHLEAQELPDPPVDGARRAQDSSRHDDGRSQRNGSAWR